MKKLEELKKLVETHKDVQTHKSTANVELDASRVEELVNEIAASVKEIQNLVKGVQWWEFAKMWQVVKRIVEILKTW